MNFFQKKVVGIDIADRTIEVAELSVFAGKPKVASLGRTVLEPGIVVHGRIHDAPGLKQALMRALREAKPHPISARRAVYGLAESQVYAHIFSVAVPASGTLDSLIREEAERSIPIPKNDLLFAHRVLKDGDTKKEVLLIASSREVVGKWQEFFNSCGIEISHFDTDTLAIFRGIFATPPPTPVCIVDIGTLSTNIAIYNSSGLAYSYTVLTGGDKFSKEVARTLSMSIEEAESQKIKVGLSNQEEKIFFALIKSLEPIFKEITEAALFYKTTAHADVGEIVLAGGSSRMPGLLEYLAANLNMPVRLAGPVLEVSGASGISFIEAIGLALRAVPGRWSSSDPALSVDSGA